MTLQSSGQISLENIRNEFSGPYPIHISDYYRGGTYVADVPVNTNIPTGGQISLSQFYGAQRYQIHVINVYGAPQNLNLFNSAMGAGLNNSLAIAVRLNVFSGGIIGATDTGQYALTTGDGWGVTPDIVITVYSGGFITGAGGSSPSARGGPALALTQSTLLYNYGIIQAGGGAGGGGEDNIFGGGAGYTAGTGYDSSPDGQNGEGPRDGNLEQGGSYVDDGLKAGGRNGGGGGGWVARPPWNYSTNGYGYDSTSAGQSVFANPNGGGAPGRALTNSYLLRSGSSTGTLRGFIDQDPGYYNYRCVGFDYYADYYNGYGGWAYDQLIEANRPACGYVEPGVGVSGVGVTDTG